MYGMGEIEKAIDYYNNALEEYKAAHLEYATGNSPIKDSTSNLVSAMAELSVAENITKAMGW